MPYQDILEFADEVLDLKLFPVQKVILKALYGIPLDTIQRFQVQDWRGNLSGSFTEKTYLQHLYNEGRSPISNVVPGKQYGQLVLAAGRRGGKDFLSACILAYELDKLRAKENPQEYYGMPSSSSIQLLSLHPNSSMAKDSHQSFLDFAQSSLITEPYQVDNSKSETRFRSKVGLKFQSSCVKNLHGSNNLVVVVQEAAHHPKDNAELSYTAIIPTTSTFTRNESKSILVSTPNGEHGLFYGSFKFGMSTFGSSTLSLQIPTWEMNPAIPAEEYKRYYDMGHRLFYKEFGAEFGTNRSNDLAQIGLDFSWCRG